MFGDAGHGFLMFLFGIYLVINERKLQEAADKNEVSLVSLGGWFIERTREWTGLTLLMSVDVIATFISVVDCASFTVTVIIIILAKFSQP